ncbi:MAG: Hsp20/alpha crystallin family protein [Deltaproteobacteria bacterium]|nr:MAG: Hsp20/alpha crystallin family protein [Deltaproteobacteria bacterium]
MTRMLQLVPRRESFLSLIPELDLFDRFFNDLSLPSFFGEEKLLVPAFDISETEKEYVITGEIPGMDVKDLDVTLLDGVLTVKGEKNQKKEDKDENYHRVERSYGSFQRNFRIPEKVETDKLDATYKDGILKLTLPKAEVNEVKKIEVKEKKTGRKVKAKKA